MNRFAALSFWITLAAATLSIGLRSASAAILTSGYASAVANDAYVSGQTGDSTTLAIPLSDSLLVTEGTASVEQDVIVSSIGDTTTFETSHTAELGPGHPNTLRTASRSQLNLSFELIYPATYSITGTSSLVSGAFEHTDLSVSLTQGGTDIFRNYQRSAGTPLVVGGTVGEAFLGSATLIGSTTGTLSPGIYSFFYSQSGSMQDIHPSATIHGDVNLTLTEVVPEPSTLALAAIGIVALAARRWRRR